MDALTLALVVPAAEAHRLATENPSIRFLDVRTPGEFESDHICGAYNVPLDALGERAAELSSSLSDPVMLVCQSGQRARQAGAMLRQAGMVNLHVLEGGVNAWLAAGLPTVRGTKRMSLERAHRRGRPGCYRRSACPGSEPVVRGPPGIHRFGAGVFRRDRHLHHGHGARQAAVQPTSCQ